jgi:transcription elongation factor
MGANDLGNTTEVEFLISQVRKHIPVGAHVKVIDGRYANETGVVVAVEKLEGETDATAVILTDMTHKEVSGKVFGVGKYIGKISCNSNMRISNFCLCII